MSPQLHDRLRLPYEAAHITIYGHDSQVFVHGRERRATAMTVQYMDHLAPVHEPEVLGVPMSTPDLVSGLQWCNTLKPEIHWATSRLTALRTPSGQGEACRSGLIVQQYNRRDN
jgi:hypothetical protein